MVERCSRETTRPPRRGEEMVKKDELAQQIGAVTEMIGYVSTDKSLGGANVVPVR
jgi:hypothetical protein